MTGRPCVYQLRADHWVSIVYERTVHMIMPQTYAEHPTWYAAMERVREWYAGGGAERLRRTERG